MTSSGPAPHPPPPGAPLGSIPDVVVAWVAVVAFDALRGQRTLRQLAFWVTKPVYEHLARRCARERATRRRHEAEGGHAPATLRPARSRSVMMCWLSPTTCEATAIVDLGDRARCAALRLETSRGRCRVVSLQLG